MPFIEPHSMSCCCNDTTVIALCENLRELLAGATQGNRKTGYETLNTGLLKTIVGVLTNCYTQFT